MTLGKSRKDCEKLQSRREATPKTPNNTRVSKIKEPILENNSSISITNIKSFSSPTNAKETTKRKEADNKPKRRLSRNRKKLNKHMSNKDQTGPEDYRNRPEKLNNLPGKDDKS